MTETGAAGRSPAETPQRVQPSTMFKRSPEAVAASEAGREKYHDDLGAFHLREAEKYEAKAVAAEAAGKKGAAARMRKVVERNRRLAAQHSDS